MLERRREVAGLLEHQVEELAAADPAGGGVVAFELVVDRNRADLAAVGQHVGLLDLDRVAEHLFGDRGRRVDVERNGYRAVVLCVEAADAVDVAQDGPEVDHVHLIVESLDADADHRQRVDAGFRRCELHGRRREDRLVDARLVDRLGIVADHHGVAFHERFHAVDARHFLHLRGEGLRAAEALYRGESLDFVGLHAFDLLVFAPLLVDGRKFPVAAEPQRRAEERDGQDAGQPAQRAFAADLQRIFGAGRDARSAERAVDMLHLVEVLDVDRIGAFASADVALGARGFVADDAQQREDLALEIDHLPEVADDAGGAQRPYPGRSHAQQPERPQQDDDAREGEGEFEDVAQRTQRADVFAPEHFDEKAAEEEQRNRNDGHPDGDLTLEARGDGVIGVEILAEKFAARRRHVEHVEQQRVFDGAEQAVGDASRADFDADLQFFAAPAHPFADGSQRA